MRRRSWAALAVALAAACLPNRSLAQEIHVTLLGTGHPQPTLERFGPSTLVTAGQSTVLVDVGRGALQRLRQVSVPYSALDAVLLTHLHSDHVVGFPDLWLTGWLVSNRTRPLRVYGPRGTRAMMESLVAAFSFDIDLRVSDDGRDPAGARIEVTELDDGDEWRVGDATIRAFLVDHRPIEPAFGFRIEHGGRSVVLSGDTRYSERLIQEAQGTDLLVHEVADAPADYRAANPGDRILAHHTLPPDAGRVFAQVAPKLAVYSHIVAFAGVSPSDLVARTRETYSGPLVVGEDLMVIDVAESVSISSQRGAGGG